MRRRLEIARGLIHRPEILFLDEPTIGLDPRGMKNMWNYIKLLAQELKITVFLTTHYMEEADTLANRVGIIDRGKIVILDSPGALKKIVGGDLVTIKATCPNIEDIKRLNFVKEIKNENSEILITVENAAENLQQILKIIGSIESVQVRNPTLNDVFLHFTGRGIQEEGDEPWLAKAAQESEDKA
jgi:ABC-2 type transport system ATP-binding protein